MQGLIDLFTGFESELYVCPNIAAGGVATVKVNITGWAWWLVTSCSFTLVNTGALVATGICAISAQNIQVFLGVPSNPTPAGATEVISGGLVCNTVVTSGGAQVLGLPIAPFLDEGLVTLGWLGGNAATNANTITFSIIGRRKRNLPRK